ncbi:hypothetical protein [Flavobacterium columnare]|uniref:Uncharacterized protein n=1 Tax=Flavobacterium columnare TaxID=996 RepID=A0AAI8CI77_9FLAO|nr:hypothetical protein [Flavobacterium columnare]AMO20671.1 hypothetical protein UN65_10280 [Flavobacterium columnare]AMO20676.1 hypothetical protein UN65_10315 [Flavobacterium columnare]AUX18643.1 hypothetical protein AQ623_10430 [Flavobacterium columnare]AUX18651.1 hypothetical protein AQ623_10470 [Flavobacterium columnare]QOG57730.1 hypothetical protein HUE29_10355 [Flavobacterium columnare]
MNLFDIIDFKNGVLSNKNACLLFNVDLKDQKYNLVEDIVQIEFNSLDSAFVDIGWYPEDFEIEKNSFFLVRAFKDSSWDNIIYKKKCKSISELKSAIEESIQIINTPLGWRGRHLDDEI